MRMRLQSLKDLKKEFQRPLNNSLSFIYYYNTNWKRNQRSQRRITEVCCYDLLRLLRFVTLCYVWAFFGEECD